MEHQVLADQAGRIGEPVRETAGDRVQQQPRRADAIAGDDNDLGRLELLDAVLVVVDDARSHAVLVGQDLAHPAMRLDLDARADRVRPIGDVSRGLGALRAGRRAMAEIDAARPALVVHRRDRGVGWPPVPAELVHGVADQRAGKPERLRRHRRVRQRRKRIAGHAGYAHHPVVLLEERCERVVIDRPVVGDAVQRLHLEVATDAAAASARCTSPSSRR